MKTQRNGQNGGPRKGEWIANLFPNRIKCKNCGGTITTHASKSGGLIRRYYKCLAARKSTKCKVLKMVEISSIEEKVFLLLRQDFLKTNLTQLEAEIAWFDSTIKAEETRLAEAARIFLQVPSHTIAEQISGMEWAIKTWTAMREKRQAARLKQLRAPSVLKTVRKLTADLEQLNDPDVRRQLVDLLPSFVEKLTIDLLKGSVSVICSDAP